MKDYYYILGVANDATTADIKLAYRKLSVKFHPDKNPGDTYFEERFKDITQAYETLRNRRKRSYYDMVWRHFFLDQGAGRIHPPKIEYFSINKTNIKAGDRIRVKWRTTHADQVMISGLGENLKARGRKSIRINHLHDEGQIIRITAINTFQNKSVSRELKISNKLFDDVQMINIREGHEMSTEKDVTPEEMSFKTAPVHLDILDVVRKNRWRFATGLALFLFTLFYGGVVEGQHPKILIVESIFYLLLSVALSGAMVFLYLFIKEEEGAFLRMLIKNIPVYLVIILLFRLMVVL